MAKSTFTITTRNFDAMNKILRSFHPRTRIEIMRGPMRSAARPVMVSAKAKVVQRTGLLHRSIDRVVRTYKQSGNVTAVIGPEKSVRRPRGLGGGWPVKYAHLVEFGTAPHEIRTTFRGRRVTVSHPGTPPRPFMRPAMDENKSRVQQIIAKGAFRNISKHIGRLPKKSMR